MDLKPVLVVLLFSTSMLAGCFGESEVVDEIGPSENVYPEPWDRSTLMYDDQDIYAPFRQRNYAIDAVRSFTSGSNHHRR